MSETAVRPSDTAALLAAAEALRSQGALEAARQQYKAVLAEAPDLPPALLGLGAMLLAAGRAAEAEPPLRRCCAVAMDAQAQHAWGLALLMLGRSAEAQAALEAGYRADPSNALCAVHLADAAQARDQADSAAARFAHDRAENPWSLGALAGWATCLTHLGQRDTAIDVLEAATILWPDATVPVALHADMLARTTRQAEAEPALRHALELDPGNQDAAMALSVVLMRLHRYAESLALLEHLLAHATDKMGPLCNMATVLTALGRQDAAVACARQAIARAPAHPAPHRALCNALPYHPEVTAAALLEAAQNCAARQPRAPHAPIRNADPARRLRVGLLSGTLRQHPVGWLTLAGFEHLDPAGFELICLTPNPPDDPIGRRFAAIATWEDTSGLEDAALASRIQTLAIDILIDLGGYGDFGRMQICARRPAPVQIKWVGMQNHSTGIPEMDWFVSDRWETPPHLAQYYSERLLLLPDGYVCYAPPTDAPPVAPLPAAARGHITYGCYNNLAKLTPLVTSTWSRILHAVPNARLILKTHQFNNVDTRAERVAAFAAHGIAAERITLRGSSPHQELLRQYADVDIVLDPFPYSGGLTTCEAMWMGVPTLTMPGQTFASRHSASHMSNIGLQDWVAPDLEAYITQAIARTQNLAALASLRTGLRGRVSTSPLCDAPRFGAGLGAALRHAWVDRCIQATHA